MPYCSPVPSYNDMFTAMFVYDKRKLPSQAQVPTKTHCNENNSRQASRNNIVFSLRYIYTDNECQASNVMRVWMNDGLSLGKRDLVPILQMTLWSKFKSNWNIFRFIFCHICIRMNFYPMRQLSCLGMHRIVLCLDQCSLNYSPNL